MNITLDTPLHKLFFKNMINISYFLLLNSEIYVLMLRNMYWCWETWEDIWCAYLLFSEFYRYGKNMKLSRLKTGSCKYGRDVPSPAFRSISVFCRKYKNRRNKNRNMERNGIFSVGFHPYSRHSAWAWPVRSFQLFGTPTRWEITLGFVKVSN